MPYIVDPDPALTFGAINLIGTDAELVTNGFRFECLGDETSWGNPVSIEQKVVSWLQDGALVSKTGDDNRSDMIVKVKIKGSDSNKLALGEQALVRETGRPNTLTWTPPDGVGEPCVFSVVMSSLALDFDDLSELQLERIYTLRIQAEPFVRSETQVVVSIPAPTGEQTIDVIDNCTSFTGWAASAPGSTSSSHGTSSGYVYVTGNGYAWSLGTPYALTLTRSGLTTDLTTSPYLRVQVELAGRVNPVGQPVFTVNGIVVPVASSAGNLYWLDTTGTAVGSTLNSIAITQSFETGDDFPTVSLHVLDVSQADVLGQVGTGRQLLRTVQVAGSARTQGTLELADETDSLGNLILVYTRPSAPGLASPDLRQYLTSGVSVTPNSAFISGAQSALNDPDEFHVFDIPVTALDPGGYVLVARMYADSGDYEVTYNAHSLMNNTGTGVEQEGTWAGPIDGAVDTVIAKLNLPPQKIGPSGFVRLTLYSDAAITLDEAWLFNIETGRLSWLITGTASPSSGGNSNRLWLDAPSVANPVPTAYGGFAEDRSDEVHFGRFGLKALSVHEFAPPATDVFTVTSKAAAANLKFIHFPRWHTHVAEVS